MAELTAFVMVGSMNLQQLRNVCELAASGFNVSRAARSLGITQPGLSIQVQRLEHELGVALFTRASHRLTGLTEEGRALLLRARRALVEVDAIRGIADDHLHRREGSVVVIAGHGHARYVMPAAMRRLSLQDPGTRVTLQHGSRQHIAEVLRSGGAHFGVLADAHGLGDDLAIIPFARFRRIVLVPAGHSLLSARALTLTDLANEPLVVYAPDQQTGYLAQAFAAHGLHARHVVPAPNADVMKTCVETGLGIAVLPEFVFDPERDRELRAIDASHLFDSVVSSVVVARKAYLPQAAVALLAQLSPVLARDVPAALR